MAEFCRACAKEMFPDNPEAWNDFKGKTTRSQWRRGYAHFALCEDCGLILVDPRGNCASHGCLKEGQPGHGTDLTYGTREKG